MGLVAGLDVAGTAVSLPWNCTKDYHLPHTITYEMMILLQAETPPQWEQQWYHKSTIV